MAYRLLEWKNVYFTEFRTGCVIRLSMQRFSEAEVKPCINALQ